ncbi:MAG: hypothetical protein ACYC3X_27895 [Pirellulaceae bacterium]
MKSLRSMTWKWATITIVSALVRCVSATEIDADRLVDQQVDIASSAYLYRADREAKDNSPESWLALMRYAGLPLNKPMDVSEPAIKQALCGLLWEEIRPVQRLELTWAADARRQPAPEELAVTTLNNQGTASSWWNNLNAVKQAVKPTVSGDGKTYVYLLGNDTCGIVVSIVGSKVATDFDVPTVRTLVADTWKKMDVEIEWGFDPTTAEKDYSGRVETYDGRVFRLSPLVGDSHTVLVDAASWRSERRDAARRGIQFSLLYMGTSKWRKVQPFTSQRDDVARTIVTLWTKSGNFSFLAADLENGPILAPEYGFFVRRTTELATSSTPAELDLRVPRSVLETKMDAIAGSQALRGWGTDATPWFGGNPSDSPVSVQGINIPAKSLAMHPGADHDVAVGWRSPIQGLVTMRASVSHVQAGSNGIAWALVHETKTQRKNIVQGVTSGTGSLRIPADANSQQAGQVPVESGDMVSLLVGPQGTHVCDTTVIELVITEVGGRGRVWDLTRDVVSTLQAGNPHGDSHGNADVWHFYSEKGSPSVIPSQPPIALASQAASAEEFMQELQARKLTTIRQQIRARNEQTWEGAVTGMCGADLPPHPQPPVGAEPLMQVQVPSERLTAQWNLGAWHLVRHCEKNPANGRLWFNDYPYGILAAETYMVLAALDVMGLHQAAEDGFDQWVSLPLDPNSKGHHDWALPDRPNGLFSEGHGCLTHAVGPNGAGGHMDGVHAFGPGSIGWALTEHYWLTGDTEWLKASAPRIKANAEWMLRQRRLVTSLVPGGERLWCTGLQPALQVTPDSGGLWMQFYECEAYYWASVSRLAATLSVIDPAGGAQLTAEAEAYRQDLRAAVERSIALSPVVPVRDGTFHSVIPFGCYVRGLSTGAWGWQRDGSGRHVGPLYWETVQSAAALISPAGLLSANDVRVQGYLDVLEDRLLLENPNVEKRSRGDWFLGGWQYQGGLERTANMHLAGDDIPVFLRSFLNAYAIDIVPGSGYIFNEHAVQGPPDKIFEEAAFLERFRNLLVMEDVGLEKKLLWLARGTPREWLEQGRKISVKNAPTHFGNVDYEIVSDADHGRITAAVKMPERNSAKAVWLRLRHPQSVPIKSVTVNGKEWLDADAAQEVVKLHDLQGRVIVEVKY